MNCCRPHTTFITESSIGRRILLLWLRIPKGISSISPDACLSSSHCIIFSSSVSSTSPLAFPLVITRGPSSWDKIIWSGLHGNIAPILGLSLQTLNASDFSASVLAFNKTIGLALLSKSICSCSFTKQFALI